jgi:protein phosphatase
MAALEFHQDSFVGRRSINEDSCLALSLNGGGTFLAVADGMGGVAGGEVASALVLERVRSFLESVFVSDVKPEGLVEILKETYRLSQEVIRHETKTRSALEGMGTTLSCVLVKSDSFVVGNVGDSRVYLFRENTVSQMTEDHTHIQEFQRATGRRADPEMLLAYGHVLTKSIDGGTEKPDIFPADKPFWRLREGDALLLCSDGLITDKTETTYDHWNQHIFGTADLRTAAQHLITEAFDAGSTDNISVVLATYGSVERHSIDHRDNQPPRTRRMNQSPERVPRRWSVLVGLLSMAFVLVIATAVFFAGRRSSTDDKHSVDSVQKVLIGPPAAVTGPVHEQGRSQRKGWIPFPQTAMEPYRLTDTFGWSEYQPQDSVDHYEIIFGSLAPARMQANYVDLKQVKGLRPAWSCLVTVHVILRDGRRYQGQTRIKLQE